MELTAQFPYADLYASDYVKYRFWHKVTAGDYRYLNNHSFKCEKPPSSVIKALRLTTTQPFAASEGSQTLWAGWEKGDDLIYMQVSQMAEYLGYYVIVAAQTRLKMERLWDKVIKALPEPTEPEPDEVTMRFTNQSSTGGTSSYFRKITAPQWPEINLNYPKKVRKGIEDLHLLAPPFSEGSGRLILFHGPPGGGKTTAIRSLCRSWQKWCRPIYVVDPEQFFGNSAYMMNLVLSDPEESDEDLDDFWLWDEEAIEEAAAAAAAKPKKTWRLLIAEDADDFLGMDARDRSGQALARLLNLSDGLVGQGLNLMLLITTNKDLEQLHPAVKRAGRCRANIHFSNFTPPEAGEWLLRHGLNEKQTKDLSLASLFEKLNESEKQINADRESLAVGTYL